MAPELPGPGEWRSSPRPSGAREGGATEVLGVPLNFSYFLGFKDFLGFYSILIWILILDLDSILIWI